jgi:hypothetical protein
MRDFLFPIELPDLGSSKFIFLNLIDGFDVRTQASMHAEDLVVDYSCQSEEIKHISAIPPDI